LPKANYIEIERKKGKSFNLIVVLWKNTIRNTEPRGYHHLQADHLTQKRHRNKAKSANLTDKIKSIFAQSAVYVCCDSHPAKKKAKVS
jgi:hypothetical protein